MKAGAWGCSTDGGADRARGGAKGCAFGLTMGEARPTPVPKSQLMDIGEK